MLVHCPGCDRMCCRRFVEMRKRRRRRRQFIRSALALGLQLFVAFWFVLGLGAIGSFIKTEFAEVAQVIGDRGFLALFGGPHTDWFDSPAAGIFYLSFGPVCFGLWVNATLGHLRPWPRWLLAATMVFAGVVVIYFQSADLASVERVRRTLLSSLAGRQLAHSSIGAAIILALALCGAPLGTATRRMWTHGRRQKYRRRLARARRRRRSHA